MQRKTNITIRFIAPFCVWVNNTHKYGKLMDIFVNLNTGVRRPRPTYHTDGSKEQRASGSHVHSIFFLQTVNNTNQNLSGMN